MVSLNFFFSFNKKAALPFLSDNPASSLSPVAFRSESRQVYVYLQVYLKHKNNPESIKKMNNYVCP